MRFCLFTPNFLPNVGGTEHVTDALAREFQKQGHDVVVLVIGQPSKLDLPYPVVWAPRPLLPRLWPERVGRALARLHAQQPFDLFLCNYAHPTGYAAVQLGRATGTPTVIVSHGGDLYRSSRDRHRPHLWKRTIEAYRSADGLIAISPYIETLIREINPEPRLLTRIPNGIDLSSVTASASRPTDFTDQRPFALCLGNLGPMKGFDDAITAYAAAKQSLGDLALVIVGNGELDQPLRKQVRELKLTDDILFMGKRTGQDKRWFLQHCQYGLMPSIEEGHPLVGLELMAAGKVVICSTNAAFDEMFTDGENSLRVPARDPKSLAQAMRTLHTMDLPAMGRVSAQRAHAFTWPAIAERYLAFLEQVRSSYGHGDTKKS